MFATAAQIAKVKPKLFPRLSSLFKPRLRHQARPKLKAALARKPSAGKSIANASMTASCAEGTVSAKIV